jgi:hypothetical protein
LYFFFGFAIAKEKDRMIFFRFLLLHEKKKIRKKSWMKLFFFFGFLILSAGRDWKRIVGDTISFFGFRPFDEKKNRKTVIGYILHRFFFIDGACTKIPTKKNGVARARSLVVFFLFVESLKKN